MYNESRNPQPAKWGLCLQYLLGGLSHGPHFSDIVEPSVVRRAMLASSAHFCLSQSIRIIGVCQALPTAWLEHELSIYMCFIQSVNAFYLLAPSCSGERKAAE